ncbi:MAG: hypothetical protein WCJ18_08160, partial [Planctomycetota bacterium]
MVEHPRRHRLEVEPQPALAVEFPQVTRGVGRGLDHAAHVVVVEQQRIVVRDAGDRGRLRAHDAIAEPHGLGEHPHVGAGDLAGRRHVPLGDQRHAGGRLPRVDEHADAVPLEDRD